LDKEQIIDEFGKLLPVAGEFAGMKIPEVLVNGNHKNIEHWRHAMSKFITTKYRPDLLKSGQ